jgi:prevent-host-death family protein
MAVERRMSAWEARRQFGKVLKDVSRDNSSVVVESHGEEVAAIVPIDVYRNYRRHRSAFFETLRAAQRNANLTEEEADRLVREAMKETGREM